MQSFVFRVFCSGLPLPSRFEGLCHDFNGLGVVKVSFHLEFSFITGFAANSMLLCQHGGISVCHTTSMQDV